MGNKNLEKRWWENLAGKTLVEFQDSFTLEQKAAVLGVTIFLMMIGGDINPKQKTYIDNTLRMLRLDPNDRIHNEIANNGIEPLLKTLKDLSFSQKEWLIIKLNECLLPNAEFRKKQLNVLATILCDLDISSALYLAVLQKHEELKTAYP